MFALGKPTSRRWILYITLGGGGRVFLGILGGGVPPGSPHLDPISDLASEKLCHHYLD